MKRLFCLFALIALSFSSCSLDDNGDSPEFFVEALPIESVDIPDEFEFGRIYNITVNYTRPTNCYSFYDFYVGREDNQRTVVVRDVFFEGENCEEETLEVSASFDFEVRFTDTYVFRFWQGQDDEGNDQYLIIEVPVVQ